ncbi:DUF2059 domain-containing protein [Ancylobacter sp. A5.8]|uniref:DUF2059 domain-containing protein n=1 Tax=Ancylobacter gelatini TaxID=2919920 RepID=UPI001F4E00E4|nr:DUF2059 domain-containing protein [Ancylobacter gelatini]MCJ8142109.1 DUF2059 domain-containing protein [Ancylobacter gelatini]
MRFAPAGRFRQPAANTVAAVMLVAGLAAAGPALAQNQPFPMAGATAAAPAKPATPPSAGQIKLANELLVANGEASAFDALIPGVIEQAANSFVQANPDLIRDLRDVAKSMIPQYENRRSEITSILAQTYAAQFSEAELTELLTFYRSPVGVKLVQRRQELLDDGLRGIQTWSAKFSREMEARVREEMKKRGFTI